MEIINLDDFQEATIRIELEDILNSKDHLAKCCF